MKAWGAIWASDLGRFLKGNSMSRVSNLSSPLLLGFDELERLIDRTSKTAGDSYPPYNIERFARTDGGPEKLVITLAVAGFSRGELDITLEENQLIIRGKQEDENGRNYLHRGIAARQFQRAFVLAEGIEVTSARLENGLLAIELERPEPQRVVRKIEIKG
jgi:HSP20 family molecular chaperone IbpA